MTQTTPITLTIPSSLGGMRLDQALQQLMPDQSRSRLQNWIKEGRVTINQQTVIAKLKVWGGEQVAVVPQDAPETGAFKAEDIAINVVYEDDHILVINKPAGMVVHPAAGNWEGTLLNALLHHAPQLSALPRAGIVHRLDKDTSGLLVVAKTFTAQNSLVKQLQERTVKREYRALVWGAVWRNGTVDQPVGRHPHARTKMAVIRSGRPAVTHYEVLERFAVHTYLRCMLETGRTHQIRVHMQFLKAPIVGDPVYGMSNIIPHRMMTANLLDTVKDFKRQALHAIKLGLIHPETLQPMEWQIELPLDMKILLESMRLEDLPVEDENYEFAMQEYALDDNFSEDEAESDFEDEPLDEDDVE
ncbi:MAG: 23S rRNA pseudouridine(1911/1915/1917) synthase RluD [Methylophilaceae bacterium]